MVLARRSVVLTLLAALSAGCGGGGGSGNDYLEGDKIVFEGPAGVSAATFKWSYRRAGDAAFTPIPAFDGSSSLAIVFAEPGDYAVQLDGADGADGTSVTEFTVAARTIDLATFTVDPERFMGAFVFTRSGDQYQASLKLNPDLLGMIRSGAALGYLFFSLSLQDLDTSVLDGNASYADASGTVTVSPQLASLTGIQAPDFPEVIQYAPVDPEVVQRLALVDLLMMHMSDVDDDGQPLPAAALDIDYSSTGFFFLVMPEVPADEIYVVI